MFVNLDYVLFVIPVSSTCIVLFNCRLNRYRYGIMRNRHVVKLLCVNDRQFDIYEK